VRDIPCLWANLAQNSREFPTALLQQIFVEYQQRMVTPSVRQILCNNSFVHEILKSKIPGAGRRVKMDRRGKQGEEYLDTLPGDLQWNIRFARTTPTPMR
jgi:hypothetical protein